MHPQCPFAQLPRDGSGQGVMQRVHLGQQPDVACRIAPGKGGGGRAAQDFDPSLLQELRDTARNLGA